MHMALKRSVRPAPTATGRAGSAPSAGAAS